MDSAEQLVGRSEWAAVNERFGRPFVVYKFAATLDGRIAARDGTSQWVTSGASRAEVHLLRAGCQATVVGSGTQRADNPNLAVRGNDDPRLNLSIVEDPAKQPLRVVFDSDARTPADANVCNDSAPTLLVIAEDADAAHLEGVVDLLRVPRSARGLDLAAALTGLYRRRGVEGLFLEGGPTLAGSFIAAGLVDRVVNYIAPALLGSGKSGLEDAGITTIDDVLRLELIDVSRSGPDVRLVAKPIRRDGDE
ncbi:RibD family protein [Actinokineospora bangkokensis]|uniref:Riboflavin biosynthesis protein RibD n=1 Tax=Actinokineospora bangkokensis TaxID=1193682 RepID=A0A1Q9LTS8_9PSEU|nr:RibD family protein [Actinokineospora bangkokensis]OLR95445.1 riboflavin biosynthesis protein RibD [Actinokineospora bangkokensis]